MSEAQANQLPEETGPSKSELKKRAKEAEKEKKKAERLAKEVEEQKARAANEVDVSCQFRKIFNRLSDSDAACSRKIWAVAFESIQRKIWGNVGRKRISITSLSPNQEGETVLFRARVNTSRAQGSKMVFLNLRQRTESVQALVVVTPEMISKQMVRWVGGLADESIILVEGSVQLPKEEVKSATVGNVEILISQIHLEAAPQMRLPFSIEDASRPESELDKEDTQFTRVLLDTRLDNRIIDLRTQTNQAVFKLQSAVTDLFSSFLRSEGFTEIHSPKLQGAATESGASVFKVGYFKGDAFLAQSPQLHKQMCIAADFERVFEIGPVFRAEDSNTHRHLTEFIGLDLEMTFQEHYHEVMDLIDGMLKSIFKGLTENYSREIVAIGKQFPADPFKWREETLKLTFKEAVDLLVEDGVERETLDDINTANEKRLGRIIKDKYDTDYFIIDKFPMALRPFYTMPDPEDPTLSNSYDFFMRGEEILSGAQRIHEPNLLIEKMQEKGINPASMQAYVDAFRLGCPPHAGGGIGLERVLMLFLKLNNIRRASLFPRDPKRLSP